MLRETGTRKRPPEQDRWWNWTDENTELLNSYSASILSGIMVSKPCRAGQTPAGGRPRSALDCKPEDLGFIPWPAAFTGAPSLWDCVFISKWRWQKQAHGLFSRSCKRMLWGLMRYRGSSAELGSANVNFSWGDHVTVRFGQIILQRTREVYRSLWWMYGVLQRKWETAKVRQD